MTRDRSIEVRSFVYADEARPKLILSCSIATTNHQAAMVTMAGSSAARKGRQINTCGASLLLDQIRHHRMY